MGFQQGPSFPNPASEGFQQHGVMNAFDSQFRPQVGSRQGLAILIQRQFPLSAIEIGAGS